MRHTDNKVNGDGFFEKRLLAYVIDAKLCIWRTTSIEFILRDLLLSLLDRLPNEIDL